MPEMRKRAGGKTAEFGRLYSFFRIYCMLNIRFEQIFLSKIACRGGQPCKM
jgi:hypothetical protein